MTTLRKRERCPLHHRTDCCGRGPAKERFRKNATQHGPVTRITDEHAPAGYRELCTPAEMRKRKERKVREQNAECRVCHEKFDDYREVDLHHIRSKKMGGADHDDAFDNLAAVHRSCHRDLHDGRVVISPQATARYMEKRER